MSAMVDRDAGFEQDVPKKLERLFAADSLGRDRLTNQCLQLRLFFWKPERRVAVCYPVDGKLHDIERHVYDVDVNVVHILQMQIIPEHDRDGGECPKDNFKDADDDDQK